MIRIKTSKADKKEHLRQAQIAVERAYHQKDSGFLQLTERDGIWQTSAQIARDLRTKFSDLVVLGVGGSSLGPQVFNDIFGYRSSTHRLHFVDNVDPFLVDKVLAQISDLKKTGFLVISKSGSTLETLALADLFAIRYQSRGLDFAKHCVTVSEPTSNVLTNWGSKHQIPWAEIPVDVGGRYSVLTACGLIPAAFIGLDLDEIRQGARWAADNKELSTQLMSQAMQSFERQEWITVLWMYGSLMCSLGGWFRQLWSESLAKKTTKDGRPAFRASTPMVAIGSVDQHSILQQVMEGFRDKWVIFVRVNSLEKSGDTITETQFPQTSFWTNKTIGQILVAEAIATQQALDQNQVSTMTLEMEDLSPGAVAAYFMMWEIVVASLGILHNIDPFNQPGVELGKRLAKEILKA